MRLVHASVTAIAAAVVLTTFVGAQGAQAPQDEVRTVAGGGVLAPGWKGLVDVTRQAGMKITDGKFAAEAGGFHITTGPAATYFNPANVARGDYTVSATFNEPQFQNLNDHPHPYGVFIGGNKMDDVNTATLVYCEAYGNGTFIVRGFNPAPFPISGRGATPNAAVHKAEAIGKPVTQDIAMSVKGDSVSCSINGTAVWTGTKADVVGPGKIESLDGVYGLRSAHNTEVIVTGFKKS